MASISIGNTPGGSVADLVQGLKSDLANGISAGPRNGNAKTAGTSASNSLNNAGQPLQNVSSGPTPVTDVASVLLTEVATSDITKLTNILSPTPNPVESQVLDSLLQLAVREVVNGNDQRAIGYLADYATRDPLRAEGLPSQPDLAPVRDKIDLMVNRMATVARMTAEDGLSRAEQVVSELTGKLSNWDTGADVLVKLAQHLFDAGGYANYTRTSELAKVVSDAGAHAKPNDQAMAAAASSAVSAAIAPQNVTQMIPGINVPYWVTPDAQVTSFDSRRRVGASRRSAAGVFGDFAQNLKAVKEISSTAARQLWKRAPLLVMLLGWLMVGMMGGVVLSLGSKLWPDSLFSSLGSIWFTGWGLGFLGIVGFGFYARVRGVRRG